MPHLIAMRHSQVMAHVVTSPRPAVPRGRVEDVAIVADAGMAREAARLFAERGVTFGVHDDSGAMLHRPIPIDPLLRRLGSPEWQALEHAGPRPIRAGSPASGASASPRCSMRARAQACRKSKPPEATARLIGLRWLLDRRRCLEVSFVRFEQAADHEVQLHALLEDQLAGTGVLFRR